MGKTGQKYRYVVIREAEDGSRTQNFVTRAWERFLNGGWQRVMPVIRGRYIVANRSGRVTGESFVEQFDNTSIPSRRDRSLRAMSDALSGWWWSEPMPPEMPLRTTPWQDAGGSGISEIEFVEGVSAGSEKKSGALRVVQEGEEIPEVKGNTAPLQETEDSE